MKFFLILAVILFAAWLWRSGRRRVDDSATRAAAPPPPPTPSSQEMVSCTWCAVHIPRSEAVTGAHGAYCCTEHMQNAER